MFLSYATNSLTYVKQKATFIIPLHILSKNIQLLNKFYFYHLVCICYSTDEESICIGQPLKECIFSKAIFDGLLVITLIMRASCIQCSSHGLLVLGEWSLAYMWSFYRVFFISLVSLPFVYP